MAKYFNISGQKITDEAYTKLSNELTDNYGETEAAKRHTDPAAIRQFENEKLRIVLRWNGKIDGEIEANYFPSDYPIFTVCIYNFMRGEWVLEPTVSSFRHRNKADARYEDLVLTYTSGAYYDEDGRFVEADNLVLSHLPEIANLRKEEEARKKAMPQTTFAAAW